MRASIVSIGSEILRGTLLDTNAQYFAQELNSIGAAVVRVTQVPDDLDSITDAIRSSAEAADLVIMTGGLGPTEDDLSREALIALTGESPIVDQKIVEQIRARFRMRGTEMPARNEKQAWRIPSAQVVQNDNGTAPGWIVETNDLMAVALPGPPRENRPMWIGQIRPALVLKFQSQAIVSRTIKTIGIGESSVADRISRLIELEWPEVGTYAKQDGVHVTITAAHPERSHADAAVRAVLEDARRELGGHVYGFGDESLPAAIVQPLDAAGISMTVWEAGSGGALLGMFLSDEQAQHVIADARAWPTTASYSSRPAFEIERFVRDAARVTGIGTAATLAIQTVASGGQTPEMLIEVASPTPGRSRVARSK
ncbi:MAG: molybdopterin-binding protein [Thermomicrobiales bacterium]